MRNKSFLLILFLSALAALLGCKSTRKIDPNINWSSRVGTYTYEQAIAELGRPDLKSEASDGSRTLEWITKQSPRMSFGFGVGGGSYGRHGGTGVGVGTSVSPPPHGEYLRLTFGADGKLTGWSRTQY